jgi:Zn finger protein HypA/HybF involved in hydrogenase expression
MVDIHKDKVKCKCSDCKVEFEYDYKISICDECLNKYKTGELPKNKTIIK